MQLGQPRLVWERTVGSTTVEEQQGTAWFTGSIDSGEAGGSLTIIETVHPNGDAKDVGTWTGTATVDGRTGTLKLYVVGTDDGNVSSGRILAVGSGGLSALHGTGTYSDSDTTGAGTYTLR